MTWHCPAYMGSSHPPATPDREPPVWNSPILVNMSYFSNYVVAAAVNVTDVLLFIAVIIHVFAYILVYLKCSHEACVAASTSQWNNSTSPCSGWHFRFLIGIPCIRISVKSSTSCTHPRRVSWRTCFFYWYPRPPNNFIICPLYHRILYYWKPTNISP